MEEPTGQQLAAGAGQGARLLTEQEKPRLKPSRTGPWGGLQRAAGNQFYVYKAANTARGHSLRPSSKRRDVQGSDQHQEGAKKTRAWKSLQVTKWHRFVYRAQTGLLPSVSCKGGER